MPGTLDDYYLTWLYAQVGNVKVRNSSRTYWNLFRQMHSTEFIMLVPNDDNRVEDGRALRLEFLSETGARADGMWLGLGCSFLEMLVAISRRLAFEGDGHADTWFWHLVENLGLQSCTDRPGYNREEAQDRIDTVIWRTYDRNGHGGLFPLKRASRDQRKVELWYQLNAYLLDG